MMWYFTENDTNGTCDGLDNGDYLKVLWTSAAELPGVFHTQSSSTVLNCVWGTIAWGSLASLKDLDVRWV